MGVHPIPIPIPIHLYYRRKNGENALEKEFIKINSKIPTS
jgi:hypothetical protein